jgi:hypothetical protein
MADKKATAPDAGQAEIQKTYDEAFAKGYFGDRPAGAIPNEAYTLQSGPASPTPFEEHVTFNDQRTEAMHASTADGGKEAKA